MRLQQILPQINDPAEYAQLSPNFFKIILQKHFHAFFERYSKKHDTEYGKLRLKIIQLFTDSLMAYGDYTKGITRIQCSNPDCRHEIFYHFSASDSTLACHEAGI